MVSRKEAMGAGSWLRVFGHEPCGCNASLSTLLLVRVEEHGMTFVADLRVCRAKRGRLVFPRAGKVWPLSVGTRVLESLPSSLLRKEYLCYRVNQLPVLKHGPRSSLHLQVRSHEWCMGKALSSLGAPFLNRFLESL